jgi:hypothetical protein
MGRPKCYASPAARQAAYRQRLDAEMVRVNRQAWAQWEARITRLEDAIAQAARAGDPLARQMNSAHPEMMVDQLIAWFTRRGQDARMAADGNASAAPARSALGPGETTDLAGG